MLTPIKAIRQKCLDCCCGHTAEIRNCAVKNCALYPYRMGHRPKAEESTSGQPVPHNPQDVRYIMTEE